MAWFFFFFKDVVFSFALCSHSSELHTFGCLVGGSECTLPGLEAFSAPAVVPGIAPVPSRRRKVADKMTRGGCAADDAAAGWTQTLLRDLLMAVRVFDDSGKNPRAQGVPYSLLKIFVIESSRAKLIYGHAWWGIFLGTPLY